MSRSLSPSEVDEWLRFNIPHRMRAMLASTEELSNFARGAHPSWPNAIVERCWNDAVWEGRLAALRWLCEFVGVSANIKGGAHRPRKGPHDLDITDLPKGNYIDIASSEAVKLSDAWKACTQKSLHPTHNSGHPQMGDHERTAAFQVIRVHLGSTIYATVPDWFDRWVLQPSPQSAR